MGAGISGNTGRCLPGRHNSESRRQLPWGGEPGRRKHKKKPERRRLSDRSAIVADYRLFSEKCQAGPIAGELPEIDGELTIFNKFHPRKICRLRLGIFRRTNCVWATQRAKPPAAPVGRYLGRQCCLHPFQRLTPLYCQTSLHAWGEATPHGRLCLHPSSFFGGHGRPPPVSEQDARMRAKGRGFQRGAVGRPSEVRERVK